MAAVRSFFEKTPAEEFVSAWAQSTSAFPDTPRIAASGMLKTYDFLRANCYTVWIKAKPQEHMDRVVAQGDFRAMAGNDSAMDDLRRILTSREPIYRQADLTLDTSAATVAESFNRLQSALDKNSSTSTKGPAAKSAGGLRG